jgi:hypothetical protein
MRKRQQEAEEMRLKQIEQQDKRKVSQEDDLFQTAQRINNTASNDTVPSWRRVPDISASNDRFNETNNNSILTVSKENGVGNESIASISPASSSVDNEKENIQVGFYLR